MSDAMNSHATAIKQAARDLAQGNIWATDRHIETIDHHADDLADELAEAKARAARLRKAVILLVNRLNAARGYEDQTGVQIESDLSWEDLHLRYGDLDAAPGDTAGER